MSLVKINWQPDKKDLRKFGLAMIVGFALIGTLFYFGKIVPQNNSAAYGCWMFGVVAGALGLSATIAAYPVYWLWMGIAFVMGNIMSRVILVIVFYGMFTPMGLLSRLVGRDKLRLKKRECNTYWLDAPSGTVVEKAERQF